MVCYHHVTVLVLEMSPMHTIEKNRTPALIWYQNYLYHVIFDKVIAENLFMIFMNSRHEFRKKWGLNEVVVTFLPKVHFL